MRSKRPAWAAAGRRSSLISALSGRRRFPLDFDELDETFDAEVGERHDAVVAEPLEHRAGLIRIGAAARSTCPISRSASRRPEAARNWRRASCRNEAFDFIHYSRCET